VDIALWVGAALEGASAVGSTKLSGGSGIADQPVSGSSDTAAAATAAAAAAVARAGEREGELGERAGTSCASRCDAPDGVKLLPYDVRCS